MLTLYVVSDATGQTAERVVRAALVQFEGAALRIVRRQNVRTPEQVRAVAEEAAGEDSIIVHTMASDQLRRVMLAEARLRNVDSLDMLGPVMDRLATHLKTTPQEKPGLLAQLVEARSREIEAVEFAFRHDDGQNAEDLAQAEVVLVGVSRPMKTPPMLYLAYRGWFAANVPLVPGIELPEALAAVPADRVCCLWMSAERLVELRRVRARREEIPAEPYASLENVRRELHYAEEQARQHRWRLIDTTGKSVEELCREIIAGIRL